MVKYPFSRCEERTLRTDDAPLLASLSCAKPLVLLITILLIAPFNSTFQRYTGKSSGYKDLDVPVEVEEGEDDPLSRQ
jgi:hypothetical protein